MLSLFYCPVYATHGRPHSSPTRRSSDLSASSPATMSPAVAYSRSVRVRLVARATGRRAAVPADARHATDRKSTRLNSSHTVISYAVFCLKKKKVRMLHNPLQRFVNGLFL